MGIETMKLMNIIGDVSELGKVIELCCKSGEFHVTFSEKAKQEMSSFDSLNKVNQYKPILSKIITISRNLGIKLDFSEFRNLGIDFEDIKEYVNKLDSLYNKLINEKADVEKRILKNKSSVTQIRHLLSLDESFDEIFSCKNIKVRFGKIPVDSYKKLSYYEDKPILFIPFDNDKKYYWGVYFCNTEDYKKLDEIMMSIFFERIRIPDYAHGKPLKAIEDINQIIQNDEKELKLINHRLDTIRSTEYEKIKIMYSKLRFESSIFEFKKYAYFINNYFYISGYIPENKLEKFEKLFETLDTVSCSDEPINAKDNKSVPIKLKNGRFSRPFESFVSMYGLPEYSGFDPTPVFALTYTFLFGLMFGDLGQGLVLFLSGIYIDRIKKIDIGKILLRVGVSSMIFGVIYGSVFGIEDLLTPFYQSLGFLDKPIHVFDKNTTNVLLLLSVFLGIVLTVLSISINIFVNIKNKNYGQSLFGPNGISGLVLYCFSVVAAFLMILLDINLLNPLFIFLFVMVPLILMFLKKPLSNFFIRKGKRRKILNLPEFIIENFFEVFEYILSYVTNTMSFLRVGGFILSHAGMMSVVMTLSEMVGGSASLFVVIIGNIFVILMEGLTVGIQVMRLDFYEFFSRFFNAQGEKFSPLKIKYKIDK